MNIYIGNLNYGVKESDLLTLVEEYGAVTSAKLIIDKYTGNSKGFGFIEMENQTEAENAIQSLNGKMLEGRPLTVKEALPREK